MRISQAIIEVENRLREDESFRKRVEKLEKDLIKQAKRKYFIMIDPISFRALTSAR